MSATEPTLAGDVTTLTGGRRPGAPADGLRVSLFRTVPAGSRRLAAASGNVARGDTGPTKAGSSSEGWGALLSGSQERLRALGVDAVTVPLQTG
jgi:hypothetical protein